MITTTVMAVRATPKALILIEERKEEIGAEKFEAMDMVKTTWACYIPAAITGTLSVACLIGASSVNARRNAALATAYTLSESALKDYQGKVIEMFGEKKNEAVKDAVAKDKVEKNPVITREVIITERGIHSAMMRFPEDISKAILRKSKSRVRTESADAG